MREKKAAAAEGAALTVGESVFYVADPCHWNETDSSGVPVFGFVMASDGPVRPGGERVKAGDALHGTSDKWGFGRHVSTDPDGTLVFENGAKVRPSRPLKSWPAVVVEYEFQEITEGKKVRVTRLALEIKHPNGFVTLHYPLEGASAVPHDPTGKRLHSYHLPGEGN